MHRIWLLCAWWGIAALASSPALAKHMYQYTDAQGVVHYTDVKPDDAATDVKSTLVRTEREPLVRLRQSGSDDDQTETFVNDAGGPVTVEVSFEVAENVQAQPALPARIVVPPRAETAALRIHVINAHAGYRYQLRYTYVPGDYRAHHSSAAHYRLPFPDAMQFRVSQAFGGPGTHIDQQNFYAVDIAMPVGTPILAARDGVVMTIDNDFFGAGLDMAKYGDRANNIRIVHDDGTMAVYAHLQLESARVSVGDHVSAGQELALSGDTGFTRGPHLHFCVQRNAEMDLVSVPFQFSSASGGFTPQTGMLVGGD
jgi:murein DD-endopeptidase MepM/ murein hydrolase activator NlpD